VRRGAAYRLVRARTLRNEESKMCHTSRVAWYKLTSARVCFGAALCFGFLFVPNGGPAGPARQCSRAGAAGGAGGAARRRRRLTERENSNLTRHYLFRRNMG